jgi:type 1 glutamine amidotransferase
MKTPSAFPLSPCLSRILAALFVAFGFSSFRAHGAEGDAPKPLKVLLIAGGCCHDYATQRTLIKEGLEARALVQVEVVYSPDRSTKASFDQYKSPDWAKGFDAIIHDECSADVKDPAYVQNVLAPHKAGIPAINLHCAMHSYRTGTDDWFKFCGIQSSSHGPQKPIEVTFLDEQHAATKGLSGWTTGDEELYNNVTIFPSATPLARGKQVVTRRDGTTQTAEAVVVWANDYHGTRVFNTTLGHNNLLVGDSRYLDLLARGLIWATGRGATYLQPRPAK